MLERAARGAEAAPALGLGSCFWATTRWKEVRGAAGLCRGLGAAGRGEQIVPREHRRSAPWNHRTKGIDDRMFVGRQRAA